MKLQLTVQQIKILLVQSQVFGDKTKSKAMQGLVLLGLYIDSGDKDPLFIITTKGQRVSTMLYALKDLNVLL